MVIRGLIVLVILNYYGIIIVPCLCTDYSFPPGFKFGAATAAYQIEGAWNVSDKSENIWDRFTHTKPEMMKDGKNGDVACDSYHHWRRDVEIAKELGLHFYRFSISWSRLLPNGFTNHVSEDGKNYYNNLINELLKNDIEPVVTLYHWDLPQILQDLGGWTNPLVADWFSEYARTAYTLYGNRVKTWITINEPGVVCDGAYNLGIIAPGLVQPDHAAYICNKNILMAHAKAYRIYDEEFRHKHQGSVSLANQLTWFESETDDDKELTELVMQYTAGRYSHPVYSKEGGWPKKIEKIVAENSKKQGYSTSRLPAFTEKEIEFIKGTYDFYALNHYTSRTVRKPKPGEVVQTLSMWGVPELSAVLGGRPIWKMSDSSWFLINPEGLRLTLKWLTNSYGDDLPIIITENGYSSFETGLRDEKRVEYYKDYLEQILLSIKEDHINVEGYTAWTLLDNFEWMDGYTTKFGLYEVDFEDPERKRTARDSALYYKEIIKQNILVDLPHKNVREDL